MNKYIVLSLFITLGINKGFTKNMIRVKAIGSSPKGQFVAFEEFGYMNNSSTAFARIRVKNVWSDKYVSQPINIISDEIKKEKLEQVRARAIDLAKKHLQKFNINT